jgi:transcriptional repressor NrdR
MKCPYCESDSTSVVDSRSVSARVRRRRECEGCGHRFTTYEEAESLEIDVDKRDGSREPFRVSKLKEGVKRAVKDTAVDDDETVREVASVVKARVADRDVVSTDEIGEMVMEALKERDEVAYLRFASVYEEFDSARGFVERAQDLE